MRDTKKVEEVKPGDRLRPYQTLPVVTVEAVEKWERNGVPFVTLKTDGVPISRRHGSQIPTA